MKNQTDSLGACFSEMFLNRLSHPEIFAPLHTLEAYQEARAEYNTLHNEVFEKGHPAGKDTVQAIINALYNIQDMEMEYIYRLGIHEGMKIHKPEFLTDGIG